MNTIAQVPRSQNDDSTVHASACHDFVGKARLSLMLAMLGATFATAVSLGIATYAGWQRGGTLVEQVMNVALGGVAVLYIHLLPMRWNAFRVLPLAVAFALWCVGLLVVMYGQVTFFMVSQQHAGNQRAATVPTTAMQPSMNNPLDRTPTKIAWDAAKVSADLARVEARRCVVDCPALKARVAILTAQLAALNTEEGEARRREAEEDRRDQQGDRNEALRATLRTDPVASTVASWVGTTEGRLELILGVACAVVLEGSAILGWLLVFSAGGRVPGRAVVAFGRETMVVSGCAAVMAKEGAVARQSEFPIADHTAREDEPSTVVRAAEVTVAPNGASTDTVADERRLEKIRNEVLAGTLVPTQESIRKLLRCRQPTAGRLNRLYDQRFGSQVPKNAGERATLAATAEATA